MTNWKYILIVVILAAIAGGVILYCYLNLPEYEFTPIKYPPKSEKKAEDETAGWKTYRNEEYGFEVKYPQNWRISGGEDFIVIFANPDSDKQNGQPFFPKITVSFEPLGYTISLERYTTDVEGVWAKYLNNYKSTGKEKVNIGGKDAYIIGGTFEEDNFNLQIKALIINKERYHFLVALKSLESAWSKYNELFVQMISTFRFLE